jgi:hypothetical protein
LVPLLVILTVMLLVMMLVPQLDLARNKHLLQETTPQC